MLPGDQVKGKRGQHLRGAGALGLVSLCITAESFS